MRVCLFVRVCTLQGIQNYINLQYVAGRRLGIVLEDFKIYSKQARELKREPVAIQLEPYAQACLNLMGRSQNATLLQGKIIPDVDAFWKRNENAAVPNPGDIDAFRGCTMRLSLVYEDYEKGADLFVKYGFDLMKHYPGVYSCMESIFSGGMCCFEMAKKKSTKVKYRKQAEKAYKIVKVWCKNGNPNTQHYKSLFNAQRSILRKNHRDAKRFFRQATTISARSGFVHDAAISSEIYGKFLTSICDDPQGGLYHIGKAVEFYAEWGAEKKVEILMEKYPGIDSSTTTADRTPSSSFLTPAPKQN